MKRALLALAVLAALIPFRVGSSTATFVAASANPGTSFSTASDFNTVAVALADPGSPLRGSVTLSATAASDRGIASVRFQTAPAGTSTWTDVCTDTVAPYGCTWETSGDGLRDVRALALDAAGYSRTSLVPSRRVDNTAPATTLADPGTPLTGTEALSASASDSGSGVASVALQYRLASGRRGRRSAHRPRASSHTTGSPTGSTTCARWSPTRPATPASSVVVPPDRQHRPAVTVTACPPPCATRR